MVDHIPVVHGYGAFAERVLAAADLAGRQAVVWRDPDQLRAGLGEVRALLGVYFPPLDWSAAHQLRLIQLAGSGADGLLPARGLPAAVLIANSRGLSAPAMAEFAVAAILALAKRFPAALSHQRAHRWQPEPPVLLRGRRAVVLGTGPVGTEVARLLRGLGVVVTGVRRTARPAPDFDDIRTVDDLLDALSGAHVVVVAVPATTGTRGMLDAEALRRCAPGCLLVNIGRGGVVEEDAVAALLREGHLAGAALDVFAVEPLPADSPLWDAPGALLTPHVSWTTPGYERMVADLFLDNVARVERGEPVRNRVDPSRGY